MVAPFKRGHRHGTDAKNFARPDEARKFDRGLLDAWVVGDEPVVGIDISGMVDYAKEA
jgi:hypothetical protein